MDHRLSLYSQLSWTLLGGASSKGKQNICACSVNIHFSLMGKKEKKRKTTWEISSLNTSKLCHSAYFSSLMWITVGVRL